MVSAKLSEETLRTIENLWYKHYGSGSIGPSIGCDTHDGDCDFVYEWWSMTFEDGKLFVKTQDGKYFIEMKEIKKGDD
jgi:hypothetical protein